MDYNITYRQKDKGWQYIISRKENSKWTQVKSKQGFKTKKDSKAASEEMLKLLKKGEEIKKNLVVDETYSDITFKELLDMYINHIELYKEYNTIQCYKYAATKFTDISDLKVKDIKKAHIQKNIDNLLKEGLRFKTVYTYMCRVKLILQYYVENFNSAYVVFDSIIIPEDKTDTDKKALTKKELDILLKELEGNKYYLAALIAGTCGLRCSEILGLTWNDIDTKKCTLNVNKQWKVDKKTKKSTFGNLKGKKSYRTVPIPPNTIRILKKYKNNDVIDINKRILPFSNGSIKRYLNPLLKRISGITIHELRHTYATLLIANRIDFKTTANFLGHDVQQTLKTYSHVTDDMIKKATDTIAKIF